jgi:ADP-ribosylglycohydrolase/protein-tyrosine phosphatase
MSPQKTRTSVSHPIRVDFVDQETLGIPGRLGMTFAPGMKADSYNGRWKRDLDADLQRLKHHYHADALVTLLEESEFQLYGVPDLLDRAAEAGLETIHFPIVDVSTPHKAQSGQYVDLIARIVNLLREGKTVVVHCRGGLGRTGTVAASILVATGRDADEAIDLVRRFCGDRAVETPKQEEYVRGFEKEWQAKQTADRPPARRTYGPEPTQIERYRGCLLGLAVGDALGTTLEFKPPGTFQPIEDMVGGGPFGLRAGEWTDDTSMALCLAESLIERRGFNPADQLQRYVRWYRKGHMSATGACFDIGNATREAIQRFEQTGEPYSGSRNPGKSGNGSIMRLAPVPLFYARGPMYPFAEDIPLEAIERSGQSSKTTHGSQNCIDACRYLGALIMGAANGVDKDYLLSAHYSPSTSNYWEHRPLSEEVFEVAAGSFKHKEPPEIKGSGYVVRSLEAALWAFHKSDTFEEGALLAVNMGDDADTTGAVYGQLAGAYYGEKAIPESWRRRLAHRLLIERYADKLLHFGPIIDWNRLLALLSTFERPGYEFAREVNHYYELSPEAGEFLDTLYEIGALIVFDWGEWSEEAERLFNDPSALANADEVTLRKLLHFHARKDRFAEDHFAEMLQSGHINVILRRIRELQT